MSTSNNAGSASLRPGWYKGAGGGGGRGFQPPPTVTSERGDKSRSSSWGSQERRDSNKFSALQDDEDGNGMKTDEKPAGNSRSEAFRSSFSRSVSTGTKTGRSLADLAARVPDSAPGSRRHSSGFDSRGVSAATGRFSSLRSGEAGGPVDGFKPDPKVLRYTREKLLSMRPASRGDDGGPPPELLHLEGAVILSKVSQDPVCWDTFDAEDIWDMYRERRLSGGTPKASAPGIGRLVEPTDDPRRRPAPSSGRWKRGVALPPPEEGGRRKERDADNPNELWDDPVGGATGAAADFSAFGAMPDDGDGFDFEQIAEATRKLDEEMHGDRNADENGDDNFHHSIKVDPSRPLASAGMTLTSGSGDDVNVFEDFDAPSEPQPDAPAIRGGGEDPNASSRLMKMIGVTKDPPANNGEPAETPSNPWGSAAADDMSNRSEHSSTLDPIIGSLGGVSTSLGGVPSSIPLNPWGNPMPSTIQQHPDGGMDLAARLEALAAEQKAREDQAAAEMEKRARQEAEMLRRRQEEEAQRRAIAQRQAEEQARHQAQAAALRQQQASQQASQQSQVEMVLMERIGAILENSWGRSDLVSILTTLHSEDSRVIPLLGNVDALRALIARSPQRVALRRDPGFGGDMAVLLMTNAQWQQHQQVQARLQQEELQRRRMEEVARAQAQSRLMSPVNSDLPWYYSDPQNNIQGPFRGEEMRQWLEAGYFKGDLPISQQPSGPFHPLSAIFPDSTVAFKGDDKDAAQEAGRAADEERQRKESEEEERRLAEEEAARVAAMAEAEARQAAERAEAERAAAAAAAAAEADLSADKTRPPKAGNEPSVQLKMMLGLSSDLQATAPSTPKEPAEPAPAPAKKQNNEKRASKQSKKSQQRQPAEPPAPAEKATQPTKSASSAWGGAANAKPKRSMSEIQQEEAQAAARNAMHQDSLPRQSNSGWANVAASGTSGWSSGTLKQAPAPSSSANVNQTTTNRSSQQRAKASSQPVTRKVSPITQQQRSTSTASTPAEEFGTTMSPALEKWCKEQMEKITGSDDLTLVAFCMTLDDANEIRQYLTTYLGATSQVNNFATEFINRRGLGSKQEEWETPGSAKKGRKKKSGR